MSPQPPKTLPPEPAAAERAPWSAPVVTVARFQDATNNFTVGSDGIFSS